MDEVIRYIFLLIYSNSSLNNDNKTSLKSGLNLIAFSNIFICNGVIYWQLHRVPMDLPVSGLFAESALRPLENKIFNSFKQKPMCWLRYVEDVFIL